MCSVAQIAELLVSPANGSISPDRHNHNRYNLSDEVGYMSRCGKVLNTVFSQVDTELTKTIFI